MLREHHKLTVSLNTNTPIKTQELNSKQKLVNVKIVPFINNNNNHSNTSGTSTKRPFIMMAIFLVFGLNIFQFVNVNLNNSPSQEVYQTQQADLFGPKKLEYSPSQQAAILADSNGALVDLVGPRFKSRHLISEDYEYQDELETASASAEQKLAKNNLTNLSKNDSSMELIFINGTWHMADLNICYKIMSLNATENDSRFYNHTHFNK